MSAPILADAALAELLESFEAHLAEREARQERATAARAEEARERARKIEEDAAAHEAAIRRLRSRARRLGLSLRRKGWSRSYVLQDLPNSARDREFSKATPARRRELRDALLEALDAPGAFLAECSSLEEIERHLSEREEKAP